MLDVHFDPYEMAYMRGGSRELLKLRLLELVQAGYLVVVEKKRKSWFGTGRWLAAVEDLQSGKGLGVIDLELLGWFSRPLTVQEVFCHDFPEELKALCAQYRSGLLQHGMLSGWQGPEDTLSRIIGFVGLGIVLMGFAVAGVAQSGSYVFLSFAAVVVSGTFYERFIAYLLTKSGKRRLKAVGSKFRHLDSVGSEAHYGDFRLSLLTTVSAFGLGVLAKTSFDAYASFLGYQESRGSKAYGIETAGGCDGSRAF